MKSNITFQNLINLLLHFKKIFDIINFIIKLKEENFMSIQLTSSHFFSLVAGLCQQNQKDAGAAEAETKGC